MLWCACSTTRIASYMRMWVLWQLSYQITLLGFDVYAWGIILTGSGNGIHSFCAGKLLIFLDRRGRPENETP